MDKIDAMLKTLKEKVALFVGISLVLSFLLIGLLAKHWATTGVFRLDILLHSVAVIGITVLAVSVWEMLENHKVDYKK